MLVKEMFTKEFYDTYGDIDVYDDTVEELGIAFCGAILTDEGKERFHSVLDLEVTINDGSYGEVAIVSLPETQWRRALNVLIDLFDGVAGYCSEEDWNKWFKFLDE